MNTKTTNKIADKTDLNSWTPPAAQDTDIVSIEIFAERVRNPSVM